MTAFNAKNCFAEFMNCMRASQHSDGSMPLVIPSSGGSDKCAVWDSALFYIPYYVYIYSGDTKIIEDNTDAMIKNLRYHLSMRDERGIIENGMGDWLPVDGAPDEYASPLGFCCSFIVCEMCRMGEIMFEETGRHDLKEFCKTARHELVEAMRREYCEDACIGIGKTEKYIKSSYRICQTSQVLGLYGDIFTEEKHSHL